MKVCLLTANFPPELFAGTEMVVLALAQALQQAGVEVFVLTTSEVLHGGEDLRAEEFAGIPVRRAFRKLDEWDQHGLHRPRLLELARGVLAAEKPDVLHAHSLAGFGARQLQQARALGIPGVLTFHDLWVTCPRYFRLPPDGIRCPPGAERETCARCVNLALHHPELQAVRAALAARDRELRAEVAAAAALTAPSRTAARMVGEHLPTDAPIAVIPHGVLRPVAAGARARPWQPGERPRVGTFGNLVRQKGVLDLVEALAGIDCELHLGGPFLVPAFAAEVRAAAARLGVELVLHGAFGPDGPHPAAGLHLAVFPSRCQETYGLVVDEALAHGVPVVVSDHGAFAERAGQPGVVVTGLDRLAAVLRPLLTDRRRLASLCARVPATLPTIGAAARAYLDLYARARARTPAP